MKFCHLYFGDRFRIITDDIVGKFDYVKLSPVTLNGNVYNAATHDELVKVGDDVNVMFNPEKGYRTRFVGLCNGDKFYLPNNPHMYERCAHIHGLDDKTYNAVSDTGSAIWVNGVERVERVPQRRVKQSKS